MASRRKRPPLRVEPCRGCPDGLASVDPCVVRTDGLAGLVEQFVDRYETRHPSSGTDALGRANGGRTAAHDPTTGRFAGRDPNAPPTAIDVLSARTRQLDRQHGVGVEASDIRRVLDRRDRTTELRVADALATAARRPFALRDGTLRIEPNGLAPADVRGQCCSGSLNGAVAPPPA